MDKSEVTFDIEEHGYWMLNMDEDRHNLVDEDEGFPAEPAHAQCLALRQLSSHPRQQRWNLGRRSYKVIIGSLI